MAEDRLQNTGHDIQVHLKEGMLKNFSTKLDGMLLRVKLMILQGFFPMN